MDEKKVAGSIFVGLMIIIVVFFTGGAIFFPGEPSQVCPYEKYFEHKGGGVYHFEFGESVEESLKKKLELDTTRTTAEVIACWCEAHKKEFRIVAITYALDLRYPPLIIITEPVK